MANNPLEQFFRQPKIFIKLPSQGVYNEPGTISGDSSNMPVYSMTAMDEIIAKTPDALFSGESMVRMIQSCVPGIKNAWDISILDTDLVFAAIRIATYGNMITVTHSCSSCDQAHEYELDLSMVVEHFSKCQYNNSLPLEKFTIRTRPINYKRQTDMQIQRYQMNKQLIQLDLLEESEDKQRQINEMFTRIATLQTEFFIDSVESIDTGKQVVTEKTHITEFMRNCDRTIYDAIKKHIETNQATWTVPEYKVKCTECNADDVIRVSLDQSNFFG